jgi:Ca-activated chloride channel family protein
MTGLAASDFIVEEDGRVQRIETFAQGDFPLAIAIGIDRSFSIQPARFAATVAATRIFLERLRPEDQVMVLGVGSETETLSPLSTDRAPANSALDRIDRWGTTPLYDSVLAAIDAVQPATGRRALIVLSDGADRYSKTSASEMIAKARTSDVLVYPIATQSERAPVLAELAAATGGRSLFTPNRGLASALASIGEELRHQYLLGYTPAPKAAARSTWRSIRVRVNRPGARVRARDGYVSP